MIWVGKRGRAWTGKTGARDGTVYNAVDCFQRANQRRGARMVSKSFVLAVLLTVPLASGMAQGPLTPPVPLAAAGGESREAGEWLATLQAAQSAHDLGFPSVAATL